MTAARKRPNSFTAGFAVAVMTLSALSPSAFALSVEDAVQAKDAQLAAASVSAKKADVGKTSAPPFGSQLFRGAGGGEGKKAANPHYRIAPGDQVKVSIWGPTDVSQVLTVDNKGNIFLPTIGPVALEGVPYGDLNSTVTDAVRSVYTDDVGVYAEIAAAQQIGVFVTGDVRNPGRYSGSSSDSVLQFLSRAGGPDEETGSYRNIEIRRGDRRVARADLYAFLLDGTLPETVLEDGDTVFVYPRGISVSAEGALEKSYRYEFPDEQADGVQLEEIARPTVRASHVSVTGVRNGKPFTQYMTRAEFGGFPLREGDSVFFHDALQKREIRIFVDGEFDGPKVMVAPSDATLLTVLQQLEARPGLTDISGVSVERQSVAARQKQALEDSLRRLEESVVYSAASSADDAKLRQAEAAMVQAFVRNAKEVAPSGRVVVAQGGEISDIRLEDQDRILVPAKSNIVYVNGEVTMPQAIVQKPEADSAYYISKAGGYSPRADKGNVLVRKVNGAVMPVTDEVTIEGGDELIVLPEVAISKLQLAKDISEVIYKIAVAASVPLNLFRNN